MSVKDSRTYLCDKKDCDEEVASENEYASTPWGWWTLSIDQHDPSGGGLVAPKPFSLDLHFCSHDHMQEGAIEVLNSARKSNKKREDYNKREKERQAKQSQDSRSEPASRQKRKRS